MIKKISVFIIVLGLVFVGIPKSNVFASTVIPIDDLNFIYGSINYDERSGLEYDYELSFDLPFSSVISSTNIVSLVINGYVNYFGAEGVALYTVWQPNLSYNYELRDENYDVIEIIPKFDTIEFTNQKYGFSIYYNGNLVKYYSLNDYNFKHLTLTLTGSTNDYQQGYDDGYDIGYNHGYNEGYDDSELVGDTNDYQQGYDDGYDIGYNYGHNYGYNEGYDDGYDYGEAIGYTSGLNESDATGFGGLLTAVFTGLGGLLAIELLPNIHLGAILAVPLVFGIIAFILGKRKGD